MSDFLDPNTSVFGKIFRILNQFFSSFIIVINKLVKYIFTKSKQHKLVFQRFQLTFIYLLASLVLLFTVNNSVSELPEEVFNVLPGLRQVLENDFLKFLTAPEKTFILYLVIIEFLINRPVFNFSLLVKFNILFVFLLEMVQNILVCCWDLAVNRELDFLGSETSSFHRLNIFFFLSFFIVFITLYIYCYISAMDGRFPKLKGKFFQTIVDSVGFWLRVKTNKDPSKE